MPCCLLSMTTSGMTAPSPQIASMTATNSRLLAFCLSAHTTNSFSFQQALRGGGRGGVQGRGGGSRPQCRGALHPARQVRPVVAAHLSRHPFRHAASSDTSRSATTTWRPKGRPSSISTSERTGCCSSCTRPATSTPTSSRCPVPNDCTQTLCQINGQINLCAQPQRPTFTPKSSTQLVRPTLTDLCTQLLCPTSTPGS